MQNTRVYRGEHYIAQCSSVDMIVKAYSTKKSSFELKIFCDI